MTKKEYQRRFHQPLFPHLKTTDPAGKVEYQRLYMRRLAELKKATKKGIV